MNEKTSDPALAQASGSAADGVAHAASKASARLAVEERPSGSKLPAPVSEQVAGSPSESEKPHTGPGAQGETARVRVRMSREERRRQLVGIGLSELTQKPIQEVSLDEVARQAGISRGLLFHYFPTKTAFYESVVRAAGRRVARTVQPDPDATGDEIITQLLERYFAQVSRRRDVYLALVQGNLADLGGTEVVGSLRAHLTELVCASLREQGYEPSQAVVHAWWAYVEDLAIRMCVDETEPPVKPGSVVSHVEEALFALLGCRTQVALPPARVDIVMANDNPRVEFG